MKTALARLVAAIGDGARPKRIATMTGALVAAYGISASCAYLSFLLDGSPLSSVWSVYHFTPFEFRSLTSIISRALFLSGLGGGLLAVATGMHAVALQIVEAARGNHYLSIAESISQASIQLRMQVLAWAVIAGLIFVFGSVAALLALPGHLPAIGAWAQTFYLLVSFAIGPIIILLLLQLATAIVLVPILGAFDRKISSITAVIESASILIRRPFHLIGSLVISLAVARVVSLVIGLLLTSGLSASIWIGRIVGLDSLNLHTGRAVGLLPVSSWWGQSIFALWPGGPHLFSPGRFVKGGEIDMATAALAGVLWCAVLVIVASFFSVLTAMQTQFVRSLVTDLQGIDPALKQGSPADRAADEQ